MSRTLLLLFLSFGNTFPCITKMKLRYDATKYDTMQYAMWYAVIQWAVWRDLNHPDPNHQAWVHFFIPFLFGTRAEAPADPVVEVLFPNRKERPGGDHLEGSGGAVSGSHPGWPGPACRHSRLRKTWASVRRAGILRSIWDISLWTWRSASSSVYSRRWWQWIQTIWRRGTVRA